jgi:uncharacterized protein (TIGR03067 family)
MTHGRNARAWAVLVGAVALVAASAGLRADDEPKVEGDLKLMQGEWVSKDDSGESTWVFKGDKLSIKTPTRAYEISLKLDSKADPKAVDFKVLEDSPNAKNTESKGIYKFEDKDKKLSICIPAMEATRPKEFKTDFPNAILFELSKKETK